MPPDDGRLAKQVSEKTEDGCLVVSLGVFRKQRLPDMRVTDQRGQEVPVMARDEQVDALAAALVARELEDSDLTEPQIDMLLGLASAVVGGAPELSKLALLEYEAAARNTRMDEKFVDDQVVALKSFVDLTQVLVWVTPTASEHVVLNTVFSTSHRFPSASSVWKNRPNVDKKSEGISQRVRGRITQWRKMSWDYIRLLLMNLGLLAVPLRLRLNGANHAHSFYLLVAPPTGTEIETLYWRSLTFRQTTDDSSDAYYESPDSNQQILGCHHLSHDAHGGIARLNVRLAGAGLRRVWLLVLAVVAVAVYVLANSTDKQELPTVAGWITAVVGALLAVLNDRSSQLSTHLGRHLQRLILLLAVMAFVLGVRINADVSSVRDEWWNHPVAIFEKMTVFGLAGVVATYGTAVLVIVTAVCFRSSARPADKRDAAHAQYSTYTGYRSRRRVASAVMLVAALISALAVCVRYDVRHELFPAKQLTALLSVPADQ